MKYIGLISDTHGVFSEQFREFLTPVDEIWHAGDIGSPLIIDRLAGHCPVRVVRGNIDGHELRQRFDEVLCFRVEECNVMMTHIGGYPGKYSPAIRGRLYSERPDIFVAGHSHILKVMRDPRYDMLVINPKNLFAFSRLFFCFI